MGYHVAITNELFAGILTGAVPMAKTAPSGFTENPDLFASAAARGPTTLPPLEPPSVAARAEALSNARVGRAPKSSRR